MSPLLYKWVGEFDIVGGDTVFRNLFDIDDTVHV